MRAKIAALGTCLAVVACLGLAACAGWLGGDGEAPEYRSLATLGHVEVRQYGPRIAAETIVDGEQEGARDVGYRRLADYFSGANRAGTSFALTWPLVQAADAPRRWRFRLFMPADATLATLPQPSDPAVTLAKVPPETVAVLGFFGTASPEAVAARTGDLVAKLEGSAWRPAGAPVAWFYDPPWKLPPRRRTEVAIPVSPM